MANGAGVLTPGTVLGQQTKNTLTEEADVANTGDGDIGTVTLGSKAEPGVYKLECIAAAADGGTFSVVAPSGYRLPDAEVGAAYAGDHLNFTIADGATDFEVGDLFTVTVSGDGKYDIAKHGDLTGLGEAKAVLAFEADASAADAQGIVIARDAIVSIPALTFHSTVDDDTKRAAMIAGLRKVGILTTEGA
ncbi:MAG: head decoration protein [Rhodospirillales bacterium]|nr:head decoration protein [Rhodospirillales bacterium]